MNGNFVIQKLELAFSALEWFFCLFGFGFLLDVNDCLQLSFCFKERCLELSINLVGV